MTKFDARQVTEALEAVVTRHGADYVYNPGGDGQCWYAPTEEHPTGCLVGEALMRLGIDRVSLENVGSTVEALVDHLGIDLPLPVIEGLMVAQSNQDKGATWGQALEYYREKLDA